MRRSIPDAIRYLGEIGDHDDVALLLEVARANPPDSYSRDVAMESAGKVGGDDAVPLLAAELKDQSIDVRQSAVRALYSTGSRRAMTIYKSLRVSIRNNYSINTTSSHWSYLKIVVFSPHGDA